MDLQETSVYTTPRYDPVFTNSSMIYIYVQMFAALDSTYKWTFSSSSTWAVASFFASAFA